MYRSVEKKGLSYWENEKDIKVDYRSVSRFFDVNKDYIFHVIHENYNPDLYKACKIYSAALDEEVVVFYDINKKGCIELMKLIEAPKEKKREFLKIIGIEGAQHTSL